MPLERDSWAINGAESSARIARLQLQSATRSGNGVVSTGDLEVRELDVPGTAVQIAAGGATILGQEATFQGSYFAYNVGTDTIGISATGSGAGRSDMVVLRVEDSNIDGTPWAHDPATDQMYYFRVIEDVGESARQVPPGATAIPLARIDIPPSTATITQDMIVDLREPANPRNQRTLRVQRGGTMSDGETWDKAGNVVSPEYERWPQHDWSVTIPEWATQVQVLANWDNVFLDPLEPVGTNDARGQLFVGFVGGPEFVTTTPSAYNFNQFSATNGYRCSAANRDQIDVPPEIRGMTVQVRMYAEGTPGQAGRLVADEWANFSVDLEFLEVAAPVAAL